jgi:TolA-binding protein
LRIFSIIGLLITVLIIGWLASTYLSVATRPISVPDSMDSPSGGSETTVQSVVDRARVVVSIDNERQRQLQDQFDALNGRIIEP